MHPNPPAETEQPGPTDPLQALDAHLADVMAHAEIAANAQRDLEAENPPATTARQEAATPEPEGEGDDDETEDTEPVEETQEESEEDVGDEDEEAEAEEPTPAPAQQQQPKYSRRDAARFAQELEQARAEQETAQRELANYRGHVNARNEADKRILGHMAQQSGYTVEQNGRFKYDNLVDKAKRGTATPEEQDELAQMTAWHEFAAPIYAAAEAQVTAGLATDWKQLGSLAGVGEEGLKRLNTAQNPIRGMQTLHELAHAAGIAKGKEESRATIAKLKAEVKSLKTSRLAGAPQPAASGGAAVPSNGNVMQRAIDPKTGLSNPDFDREVAQGKWLGVDLSSH
jgi:hypothetical protein